jgi:hypothetical protein
MSTLALSATESQANAIAPRSRSLRVAALGASQVRVIVRLVDTAQTIQTGGTFGYQPRRPASSVVRWPALPGRHPALEAGRSS